VVSRRLWQKCPRIVVGLPIEGFEDASLNLFGRRLCLTLKGEEALGMTQATLSRENAVDQDLALIDRALGGDGQAFEELVRRHEARVYRTALGILGKPEDAEEAFQDTFLNAYQHLREFRRDSRFTTWLTRIAINAALNKLRGQKETLSLDATDGSDQEFMPQLCDPWQENPEHLYASEEVRRIVHEAIAELPPDYRVVLVLRDILEMDTVQTAEALGLTIGATKSRLLRARLIIREKLAARFEKKTDWRGRWVRMGWMIRGMVAGGSVPLPSRKAKRPC
jgi:RNA polymerase sigma-70 factor (ECF subfamily)